ncbi:hypothetical protein RB195_011697 [Necator americanus]
MPMLSSTFVTDGQTTAVTKPVSSEQLIPNTVGQLQCMSHSNAKHSYFPSNAYLCSPATNQAVYTCSNEDISELFKKTSPQFTENVLIYQYKTEIIAKPK